MAISSEKKKVAEASALVIAERLARLQPKDLSERQWCERAGVSPSFFSNLRGTPSKPPSEPSVGNLKAILGVAGVTLAEFFLDDAHGRVSIVPSRRALERAFGDALDDLPKKGSDRPGYLAEVVRNVLALPADRPATPAVAGNSREADDEEAALPRATTRQA